jgi:hypothetical protein
LEYFMKYLTHVTWTRLYRHEYKKANYILVQQLSVESVTVTKYTYFHLPTLTSNAEELSNTQLLSNSFCSSMSLFVRFLLMT